MSRTHSTTHGTASPRDGGKHPGGVLVAGPEPVLHVVEGSVEGYDGRHVRLVRQDQLLKSRDNLVVRHGERVDVQPKHTGDHLTEVQQLNAGERWFCYR